MPIPMPYARTGVIGGIVIQVSRSFCICGETSVPVVYEMTHVCRSAIVEMSAPAVNAQLGLRFVASASASSSVCTVVPWAYGAGMADVVGHDALARCSGLKLWSATTHWTLFPA